MLSLSFGSWAPRVSRRAWIRGANVHVPTARVRDERKRRRGQHNAPEALHVLKAEDRMSRHERRSLMKPAIRVAGRNQYNRKRRWAEEGSAGLDARRNFGVHVSSNLKSSAPQRRIRSAALMGYVRTYVRNTHAMQVVVQVRREERFVSFDQSKPNSVMTAPRVVVASASASAQRSPEEGVSDDGRTTASRFSWGERVASLPAHPAMSEGRSPTRGPPVVVV